MSENFTATAAETTDTQATPTPSAAARDAKGRFAKGNPGGPGNPFARQVGAMRSGIFASNAPEDIQQVLAKLKAQALEGNVQAAKAYLS